MLIGEYYQSFSKSGLLASLNLITSIQQLISWSRCAVVSLDTFKSLNNNYLTVWCKGKKHTTEAAILESLRTSIRQWLACYVVN